LGVTMEEARAFLKKSAAKNFCSFGLRELQTSRVKTNKSFLVPRPDDVAAKPRSLNRAAQKRFKKERLS